MAVTYEFIDDVKSFVIKYKGQRYRAGKNDVELIVPNETNDNILKIRSNSAQLTDIEINLDEDTILGVGAGSTTATALDSALGAIFFLDESGGGGADVMTKTEFNEIANTYAAFGYTQKTSASGLPLLITGVVGIGSNNLTPPDSPQPITGGDYNGYVKIENFVEIAANETLTVSNSEIVIGQAGNYFSSHAWIDVSSSINTNTLGLVFCIERGSQLLFSARPVGTRGFNGNNRTNLSGGGFLDGLEVGDKISVWIGSEDSADLSIYDCNVGINLRSKN